MNDPAPRCVHIVVYPGFKALEAIGTMSVFEYANVHLQRQGRPRGYDITLASSAVGPVPSDMLMTLQATKALDEPEVPDIAIVVGARDIETALANNPALVAWARNVAPQVKRLVGLCSGSFFLAAAGLLQGKEAATHWSVAGMLQARYPEVAVNADAIYVSAGRIWTSAGVTACIDLALALVEEDHGRALALEVARDLVVYLKRPGGQSQFSVHLASQTTTHPGIRSVQDWVLANLQEQFGVGDLARKAAMSERNFRRVFAKEVGAGPVQFIETARLEAARRLLEDGNLPLKSVARRVGLGSDQSLRKLFIRHLGVGPNEYRARFGGAPRA
ncbi:MAG TPA: GlxA family transcriptional regulator [Ramlibacter sp.]|nr:GlxA family transcriptional regulator [Ramlibacter sp.]